MTAPNTAPQPAPPHPLLRLSDGFVPLYRDEATGAMAILVRETGTELLYVDRLSHAVGDYRLERGNLSRPQVVRFEQRGAKLFLIAANYAWRSSSPEPAQQRAVRSSFPESVLWAFDIQSRSEAGYLLDATAFFLRDSFDIAGQLGKTGQGPYTIDPARSAIAAEGTGAFPLNTQVESILTFSNPRAQPLPFWFGNGQVEGLAALTPDPRSVTIRVRTCFIRLPEPGFKPRLFDPRASFFSSVIFHDFARSLELPPDVHYALRHRLEKRDPTAAISEPVKPILYHIDRGAPEPMRTALLEGARWWNKAFEAAGFRNAFQVELLPEDADPIDIRYNIITWVPRATRGFSNGKMIWDPRTGEILQGVVTLTALRDRHLRMISEALLSPYADSTPCPEIHALMMARLRQLSAHEVGHTLGLDHNHVASTLSQDMSVCDYPAPLLKLDGNGRVDLSAAYGLQIGRWDEISITWGYHQFPPAPPNTSAPATPSPPIPASPSTPSPPPKAPPPTASPSSSAPSAPPAWSNTTSATQPCPACTKSSPRHSTPPGTPPPKPASLMPSSSASNTSLCATSWPSPPAPPPPPSCKPSPRTSSRTCAPASPPCRHPIR